MKPNLALYKLDQDETREYIKAFLKDQRIPYLEHSGCVFGVRFPDRPLFLAHMDTVGEHSVKTPLNLTEYFLKRRHRNVLGADDKAGIDILLRNIQDINFCFTRDEETGCQGIRDLIEHSPFLDAISTLPCAIEYDRKNHGDLIAYCSVDLITEITKRTHYREAAGLFSDVTYLEHLIPGVNLSVGYYEAHTPEEFLSVPDWNLALKTLPTLNDIRGQFDLSKPAYYTKEESWFQVEDSECITCGVRDMVDFFKVDGYGTVCAACLADDYGIHQI